MSPCRFDSTKTKRCHPEARINFEWRPWRRAALAMVFSATLACWCALILPGPVSLVKNMIVSIIGGDAGYWADGRWRSDALTLDSARHWIFDPDPATTAGAEGTSPTMLVSTNSCLLKPTV